jgi:hypothetical protein
MHLLFSRNRNDKGNGDKSAKSSEPKKGFDFLEEIPEELEMRLR